MHDYIEKVQDGKITKPDEKCQVYTQQGSCYFSSKNWHDPLNSTIDNSEKNTNNIHQY